MTTATLMGHEKGGEVPSDQRISTDDSRLTRKDICHAPIRIQMQAM